MWFSSSSTKCIKIYYVLDPEGNLNTFERTGIMQETFSEHIEVKVQIKKYMLVKNHMFGS